MNQKDFEKLTEKRREDLFNKLVLEGRIGEMERLATEVFQVKPELPEGIVQQAYANYIWKHLSKETVDGWMGYLERLHRMTGIKPNISEDVVQGIYANCVKEGYNLYPLVAIKRVTGIEPRL